MLDTRAENPVYHRLGEGQFDRERHHIAWWTQCGKSISDASIWQLAYLPRWRAELIARPCKRCHPECFLRNGER